MTTTAHRARPAPTTDHTPAVIASVDAYLADFLAAQAVQLTGLDGELASLTRTAGHAVLGGGKRLRPVFAYWGWRGVAGPDADLGGVLPALSGLEMLHAFALVHDDVMDEAAMRRGRPSAHVALATTHRDAVRAGVADRFGTSAAILVGDLCLVWADQLIARASVPPTDLLRARQVYDLMRVETVCGQFLDVLGEASLSWSLRRATRVVHLKTAAYTVVRPLHFGAALAGDDGHAGRLIAAYTRYGAAVGEAFQLRDDLLDAYGDPSLTGKPAREDLARARPTVLLETARRMADRRQRVRLERALRGGADPAELAAMVEATGARHEVERHIEACTTEALAALADAPIHPDARAALSALATIASARVA